MFDIQEIDDQIISVQQVEPFFSVEMWKKYQQQMLDLLNTSDKKLYILSDFRNMEAYDTDIVSEVGTAKHLTHEKLGMIVLLGGTVLGNFILMLTENKASKQERNTQLRIHKEYDRALQTLRHYRNIHQQAPPESETNPPIPTSDDEKINDEDTPARD